MGKKKKRAQAHEAKREASAEGAQAIAQPAAAEPEPAAAITERRRMLENAFIALFLAFMLGMPLRYYLGERGFDERFSWRMFSTIRMLECKAKVVDVLADGTEQRVDLGQEVQVAWVGLLERGRELVIEKLLSRRCGEPGVSEVRYRLSCTSPDGKKLPELKRQRACGAQEGTP